MALEAWAHQRIENGDLFESVLEDVVGEKGTPAAYLLPVIDLILSHWPKSMEAAVPFCAAPELLVLDRSRAVADSMPKLPDLLGLDEIQKEPSGSVRVEDLKSRPSRKSMLDDRLGDYPWSPEAATSHAHLHDLLMRAAERLGEPTLTDDLGVPAFMAVHALNLIDPRNWRDRTLPLKDGTLIEVKEYVAPPDEEAHLAKLRAERADQNLGRAVRISINAAVADPLKSTEDFLAQALAHVQRPLENTAAIEEEHIFGDVAARTEESIKVALLVTRDGSPSLRKEQDRWVRNAFALSFTDEEHETHRHRSENRFNPQAFSFVGYFWLLKHQWTVEHLRLLLDAAGFANSSASMGFQAIAPAVAGLDERLVRSVLRVGFKARIKPGGEWVVSKAEREQQRTQCTQDLHLCVEAELRWLDQGGAEPEWPRFPLQRPSVRDAYRLGRSGSEKEEAEEVPSADRLDVESYGAAMWLKAAAGLFDFKARPWLQAIIDTYREWTATANGAGIDKGEQLSGEPEAWNAQYVTLLAYCLAGLSINEIEPVMSAHFGALPDETLFDNLKILLRSSDDVFFNKSAITPDCAVRVRSVALNLLQDTRGWRRLREVRKKSAEMHISAVVATLFFNDPGNFIPAKCYLVPGAIPRVEPFLTVLARVAEDCRAPLLGLFTLNLIEISPSQQHLGFLVSLASGWLETYEDNVEFWIEYQFGKRLCALFSRILTTGDFALERNLFPAIDRLLGHLVKLGLFEAHQTETLLRTLFF